MKLSHGIVPAILALALLGCGGSNGSSSSSRGRGSASLRVIWPSRDGRGIPVAANSVRIVLSQGGSDVASELVARPTLGNETQTEFTDLPVGTLAVAVTAYPNADGTGVGQAAGTGTLITTMDEPATATVSLASTAVSLTISPTTIRVGKGATISVSANATDARGNVVLLSASGANEPIQWSVDDATVATVTGGTANATLKGLKAGTVTVKAKMVIDDEGNVVTGTNTGTVVSASGTVIVK
jgi:hypothetical protein